MKTRTLTVVLALAAGIAATVVLEIGASYIYDSGFEQAAQVLAWPNTLLQMLVSLHNIGTEGEPFYEGTPLNLLAYFASLPLSVLVYSVAAYIGIRVYQSKSPGSRSASVMVSKE